MDLWNLFLKRTFGIPSLNYCLLGRWLRHMPEGTFRHAIYRRAPETLRVRGWKDCPLHYRCRIGAVFVALVSGDWLARPTLLPALLYGIGTVVFPFFIMQPSFGLGMAARERPSQPRPG